MTRDQSRKALRAESSIGLPLLVDDGGPETTGYAASSLQRPRYAARHIPFTPASCSAPSIVSRGPFRPASTTNGEGDSHAQSHARGGLRRVYFAFRNTLPGSRSRRR